MYDDLINELRQAYGRKVAERDQKEIAPWKEAERHSFLAMLKSENKKKLLEIGAGTGVHGKFFHEHGLDIVCTDLSPEMVKRCHEKGLTAYEMDFLKLDFAPGSFDAIFAMNCLLHVPKVTLPRVLAGLNGLLNTGGLFYWGQYGGIDHAGAWEEDRYEPKRFFAFYTDDQIRTIARQYFEIVIFRRVASEEGDIHFQGMVLRKSID